MAIFQKLGNQWTKDGKSWYFKYYYTDIKGKNKPKESKVFLTKKELKKLKLYFY